MSKLRIVLGVQLLFFAVWGGFLLSSRNTDSPEFYLETIPVDPRDLLSGTYVSLSYDISAPKAGSCPSFGKFGPLFVKLEDKGRTAYTAAGPAHVYEAADCAKNPPREPGWAAGTLQYGFRGTAVSYGIEKFFLNENDPRKDARSGSVIAKVKIDRRRRLVLLDLAKKL
jgi:uncharacterized membrane-anchored protein